MSTKRHTGGRASRHEVAITEALDKLKRDRESFQAKLDMSRQGLKELEGKIALLEGILLDAKGDPAGEPDPPQGGTQGTLA